MGGNDRDRAGMGGAAQMKQVRRAVIVIAVAMVGLIVAAMVIFSIAWFK